MWVVQLLTHSLVLDADGSRVVQHSDLTLKLPHSLRSELFSKLVVVEMFQSKISIVIIKQQHY